MKRLTLTSSGFLFPSVRTAIEPFIPQHRPLKVAYIPTASRVVKDDQYAHRDVVAMRELGFDTTELDLSIAAKSEVETILPQQDAVYVQGGNGFFLLKHARRTDFIGITNELVKSGKLLYIGKSTGSYLACPTLEVHTWHSDQWNRYGVEDLTAMHLVDFLIQAHFDKQDLPILRKHSAQSIYPIRLITNEQALIVEGDNIMLVGEGPENKL